MLRSLAPLLGASFLLLTGCDALVDCTTEARSSVQLTVVDAAGAPIAGAAATYTIEGESWPSPQDCEAMGDGVLVCGWEVEDVFHIEVTAPGYLSESLTIEVYGDECHVITEQIEVTLQSI